MDLDLDLLLTGRGLTLLRAALRVVGWSFVAVFVGVLYVLVVRFLRAVVGHAGAPLSPGWCLELAIGVWLLANVLGNYVRCIATRPGVAPRPAPSAPPPTAADRRNPRFCADCGMVPPPRASHCHFCDACVLRMDHHCPWVLGCVGYLNHPYFVLYLVYCELGTIFLAVVGRAAAADAAYLAALPPERRDDPQAVVTVSLAAGLLVLAFGGFHVFLAATDQTSLEFVEGRCMHGGAGGGSGPGGYAAQFDRGVRLNLRDLLGAHWQRRWWRLLLPLRVQREGDGIDFVRAGGATTARRGDSSHGGQGGDDHDDAGSMNAGAGGGAGGRSGHAREMSPLLRV